MAISSYLLVWRQPEAAKKNLLRSLAAVKNWSGRKARNREYREPLRSAPILVIAMPLMSNLVRRHIGCFAQKLDAQMGSE